MDGNFASQSVSAGVSSATASRARRPKRFHVAIVAAQMTNKLWCVTPLNQSVGKARNSQLFRESRIAPSRHG